MASGGRARATADFFVRLILYAFVVGVAIAIAGFEWSWFGLSTLADGSGPDAGRIARWHDRLPVVVVVTTFVTAALGSVSRRASVFFLVGFVAAVISAPIFIAKATGGM